MGHALKEARDFTASMEAYHAAYRIDARDSDLLVNIGHLHKMRGQQAAACFAYVASYALDANADAATELEDPLLAADIAVARGAFFADPTRDPVVLTADLLAPAPTPENSPRWPRPNSPGTRASASPTPNWRNTWKRSRRGGSRRIR